MIILATVATASSSVLSPTSSSTSTLPVDRRRRDAVFIAVPHMPGSWQRHNRTPTPLRNHHRPPLSIVHPAPVDCSRRARASRWSRLSSSDDAFVENLMLSPSESGGRRRGSFVMVYTTAASSSSRETLAERWRSSGRWFVQGARAPRGSDDAGGVGSSSPVVVVGVLRRRRRRRGGCARSRRCRRPRSRGRRWQRRSLRVGAHRRRWQLHRIYRGWARGAGSCRHRSVGCRRRVR